MPLEDNAAASSSIEVGKPLLSKAALVGAGVGTTQPSITSALSIHTLDSGVLAVPADISQAIYNDTNRPGFNRNSMPFLFGIRRNLF